MSRRFGRDDAAQALVELALILPVFMMLVVGLLDVSRAVFQENTLAYAAREGTRYAIVHGSASSAPQGPSSTSTTDIVNAVTNATIGVQNVTVTVTYPDSCNDRGCRVQVDATAPFTPMGSDWITNGVLSVTLRGGSLLVIQQ